MRHQLVQYYLSYTYLMKWLNIILLLLATITISTGCKKGKLNFNNVQKIETGTDGRINKILFADNQTSFAVGGKRFLEATILTSTDGGNNWTISNHPESGKGIYGISQSATGRISTIGFDGKVLSSDDTGKSWQFTQFSPWYSYKDIYLKANNTGIVIGGNSFRSGYIIHFDENHQNTKADSFAIEFNDIEMLDDQTGFVSGYGVVLKTTDGGQTWNYLNIKNDNFSGIYALNHNNIWVCGRAGSVFKTNNGGSSWERLRNGNAITKTKYKLNDILFIDSQTGWAVGEDGLVIKTTDGGSKWEKYKDFTASALFCIERSPDGNLLVGGEHGTLYKLYIN